MITKYTRLILSLLFLASSIIINSQTILYVKKGSTGNGLSWNNAYGEVADALKYAKQTETQWTATKPLQIWVAKGTYKPLYDPADNNFGKIPNNPRDVSFLLVNNVQLYGGFTGTETDLTTRDWETNKTILSGDIGTENVNTDNAYNVVLSHGKSATETITANTVLDGFTISGGNANLSTTRIVNGVRFASRQSGGGIYNSFSSPILTNLTISENTAYFGGGIYNFESSPILTNVILSGNKANRDGGGMYNNYSSPTLTNVTISGNMATQNGGGMYNWNYSSPTLTNATISGNKATSGGGMYNLRSSSPTLTNVTISGNTVSSNGGGMYNMSSSPTLTNVTISGNTATNLGGGMYVEKSPDMKIYNSIILGNNTGIFRDNFLFAVRYSLVQETGRIYVGDISSEGVKATDIFLNPVLATAGNPTTNGDYRLKKGTIVINKGSNSFYDVTKFGNKDLAGNPRIFDNIIDLGAFESQTAPIVTTPTNNILYVTQNGAGLKNGSSWANALSEVADALKWAKENETDWTATKPLQIWVAKGTYKPKYSPNNGDNLKDNPTDPRDVSFLLVNNVQLYGGFAGTENTLTARNWETNKTILSGDIGKVNDTSDNVYNVVLSVGKSYTEQITDKTVVDGFTISYGNADGINQRLIAGHYAHRAMGGGMQNLFSSPRLTNVTLSGNTADNSGGGMYNSGYSSPILTNVTISGNTAILYNGGGMYNESSSSPTLTNVTISGNRATNGGGMYNRDTSSPTLTNVTISGNTAGNGGGVYNNRSSPTLTNVTISGNTATDGGVMFNISSSKPKIYNSIILGNNTGIVNENATNDIPEIQYSLVQGLTSTFHGNLNATYINAINVFVDYQTATANKPTTAGDFSLKNTAMVINKGDNSLYDATKFGSKDLAGNPRIYNNGVIDLGAYEYQGEPEVAINNILYVTQTGAGAKNGSSWANALSEVADALKLANETQWTEGKPLQIWVAKGTYKPLYDTADDNFGNEPINPRDVSFLLVNNVQLYGGFAGNETDLKARNWTTNKTVLSGDIGTVNDITDNAYNVVLSIKVTDKTVVDGFTISGGNANGDGNRIVNGMYFDKKSGGGMYNNYSSPTLTNVTLSGNTAEYGGGMYNWSSYPTLTNVTLSGNTASSYGGGMYNTSSSPILTNVTISGNIASYGGGMYNKSSSPTLTNVTISGNTASSYGGGMYNWASSKPKIYNSILLGNNTGIMNSNISNDVPEIKNSLVQDLTETSNGNLNAIGVNTTDIFVDYQTATTENPTTAGDFSLKNGAIVINKGDNSLYDTPKFGDKDLAGNPRIYNNGVIDLGAYEYQGSLSISEVNSNREVKTMVYPNPTIGIFFVKTDKESKAVLYDLSGKLIQSISLKKGENQVDISHLTKGMYLLKTENGTFKVIKK